MSSSKSSRRRLAVFILRLLVSKNEYECLEVILSPYTPQALRAHLPSTADFNQRPRSPNREISIREAAIGTRDEFLPSTVRQGTRVFAATYAAATLIDVVLIGIIKKHGYFPREFYLTIGAKPFFRIFEIRILFKQLWRHL